MDVPTALDHLHVEQGLSVTLPSLDQPRESDITLWIRSIISHIISFCSFLTYFFLFHLSQAASTLQISLIFFYTNLFFHHYYTPNPFCSPQAPPLLFFSTQGNNKHRRVLKIFFFFLPSSQSLFVFLSVFLCTQSSFLIALLMCSAWVNWSKYGLNL